jgi:hypothetical protein
MARGVMFSRTGALGRITKKNVRNAHVRRGMGNNSPGDDVNAYQIERCLLQSRQKFPCLRGLRTQLVTLSMAASLPRFLSDRRRLPGLPG